MSSLTITIRTVVFSDNLKQYSTKQNIHEDKKPIKSAAKLCGISSFVTNKEQKRIFALYGESVHVAFRVYLRHGNVMAAVRIPGSI